MVQINCLVNDQDVVLEISPNDLLLDVIRGRLGLTGAKPSCDAQVCGACTVLLDGLPVSSCTTLALEAHGGTVDTVEGLAADGDLTAVQQAFVDAGAVQCGYCTPGMVLMVESLMRDEPSAPREAAPGYLKGTLCRCTGYVKILEAIEMLESPEEAT